MVERPYLDLNFAGTTVDGLLETLTVSNSAEKRSFLLTMCTLALESTTNSLSSGFYCGCGRQAPLIGRRKECSFVQVLELKDILGKSPRVSAGASLLSFSLFVRSAIKFHSVVTALMRKFDLYFIQRWTFVFSDVRLTQRSSCESHSSNWSQDFWAFP